MQWTLKRILVAVAAAAALWFPIAQAEETETLLRWKNGDVLPGQLQESSSGTIRWASPYFLDDLVLDVKVLDSVAFPKKSVSTTEAFRVSALSGDVWIADLIGSDDETFLFSSKRNGQFRVNRSAVYMLERQERPDFLFDGSQLKNWKLPLEFERQRVNPAFPFDSGRRPTWFAGPEGHPKTWIAKAEIFHAFSWPERFEIELELASVAHPPNFSFALGKDLYQALRLEIWKDELVAVQGVLFKSVLAIQPEQRNVRLRLTYDEGTGVLKVFDSTGNLLLNLDGVKPTVKESGLYIQNRGKDLTVRSVKVYRQLKESAAQRINFSQPRVYMTNGERIQGRLFVQEDGAYVLDTDGTRRDIDLQELNHILQPGIPLTALDQSVTLKYPDETVLHGKLMQVNSDSVILQTAFANEPVTCSLANASLLSFAAKPDVGEAVQNTDKLFYASGNLRGRVLFGGDQAASSIQWESVGALKPVRLANNRASHIERNNKPVSKIEAFDTAQFRHTMHLQSGEILPCQITSYDGKSVSFRSPFISAQHLDSVNMKALEFSGRTHAPSIERTQPATDFDSVSVTWAGRENGIKEIKMQLVGQGKDGKQLFIINADNAKKMNEGQLVLIVNEKNRGREWIEIENRAGKDIRAQPGDGWVGLLSTSVLPDPEKDKSDLKLERALTVPRFNRDNPPNHILVAKTGDMKRGRFLGFRGQTVQFDSKLQKFFIPIDRVARVVDVSGNSLQLSVVSSQLQENVGSSDPSLTENRKPKTLTNNSSTDTSTKARVLGQNYSPEVRVTLTDGSILVFEPLEVRDGQLMGRSPVYGELSVPVSSIEYLYFGEKAKSFKAAFEKWSVRPAKEPAYGDSL